MKTRKDYNYRQISVIFDLDVDEDRKMIEWLEAKKGKRNSLCVLIKKAISEYITGDLDDGGKTTDNNQ